jgi:hypothetical protein
MVYGSREKLLLDWLVDKYPITDRILNHAYLIHIIAFRLFKICCKITFTFRPKFPRWSLFLKF